VLKSGKDRLIRQRGLTIAQVKEGDIQLDDLPPRIVPIQPTEVLVEKAELLDIETRHEASQLAMRQVPGEVYAKAGSAAAHEPLLDVRASGA
jgi:hypothetical protein